jgi:hypothetical protein
MPAAVERATIKQPGAVLTAERRSEAIRNEPRKPDSINGERHLRGAGPAAMGRPPPLKKRAGAEPPHPPPSQGVHLAAASSWQTLLANSRRTQKPRPNGMARTKRGAWRTCWRPDVKNAGRLCAPDATQGPAFLTSGPAGKDNTSRCLFLSCGSLAAVQRNEAPKHAADIVSLCAVGGTSSAAHSAPPQGWRAWAKNSGQAPAEQTGCWTIAHPRSPG